VSPNRSELPRPVPPRGRRNAVQTPADVAVRPYKLGYLKRLSVTADLVWAPVFKQIAIQFPAVPC
jgi:hypothetical protein